MHEDNQIIFNNFEFIFEIYTKYFKSIVSTVDYCSNVYSKCITALSISHWQQMNGGQCRTSRDIVREALNLLPYVLHTPWCKQGHPDNPQRHSGVYVCVKSFFAAWQPSQGWRKRKNIRKGRGVGGGYWKGVDGGKIDHWLWCRGGGGQCEIGCVLQS